MNPMDVRRGINLAVDQVVKTLKANSKPVNTTQLISDVATISANGDREIGELIAKLMEKTGEHGTITVADGINLIYKLINSFREEILETNLNRKPNFKKKKLEKRLNIFITFCINFTKLNKFDKNFMFIIY